MTEALESSEKIGAGALELMDSRRIPANPRNYAVWYAYQSGRYAELQEAIDGLLAQGGQFTEERNEELYQRFFGQETSLLDLDRLNDDMGRVITQALSDLGEATKDVNSYGKKLVSFSGNVAAANDSEDIHELIGGMVEETLRMEERNRSLEQKVNQSSQHISELSERLEVATKEAMTDALTGLANRKCFDQALQAAARDAHKSGQSFSLILMDIDHFKKFNDTHGHQIGDQVLKLVAMQMRHVVKGIDTSARYGGEEFAVVLPKKAEDEAFEIAESLRNRVASKKITRKATGQLLGQITLSIGVAQYRLGEPLGDVVERADKALYSAKNSGRNRVVTASGS